MMHEIGWIACIMRSAIMVPCMVICQTIIPSHPRL